MTKPFPPDRPQSSEPPTADLIRRARGHAAALSYVDETSASESASIIDELATELEKADTKLAALAKLAASIPEPMTVWGIQYGDDPRGVIKRSGMSEAEARHRAEPSFGDVVMRRLVYPTFRTEWVPADG